MAEKNEDDKTYSFDNLNSASSSEQAVNEDNIPEAAELYLGNRNQRNLDQLFDSDLSAQSYESPSRKEENPFSFKKFLNQDTSKQRNKGARRKVYSPVNIPSPSESSSLKHSFTLNSSDVSSRLVNTPEMSSVLPDFVQDHLVIEQCYLSGSSLAIDIDNLNLQNLPDLNLEHRELDFTLSTDRKRNDLSHSSSLGSNNLPDFTLSAGHFKTNNSENGSICSNKGLPDFALNANDQLCKTMELNGNDLPDFTANHRDSSGKSVQRNNTVDSSSSSHYNRHRIHISSSPSVPLDLPSYDGNEPLQNASGSLGAPLPFDLPIPAEERSNNARGMPSAETVSKSLPDFLSDGPIRKERLDENIQNSRGNLVSQMQQNQCNGLPAPEVPSPRSEQERLQREVDSMRRQLLEKNRRIEMLESEIEHLHSRDQRETTSLEYALQQVENNLQQTAKRANTAETTTLRLKQEVRMLKSEISILREENSNLKLGLGAQAVNHAGGMRNQKVAKELILAANVAESSLRSLLNGIDNLRVIAANVENMHKFQDEDEENQDFSYEDSASGPAL